MSTNVKKAFISFLITFTLLFPISTVILVNIKIQNDDNTLQNVTKSEYNIPKEQDLNILFAAYDNEDKSKKVFFITKISPHDNEIYFSSLNPSIVTVVLNKEDSLGNFLDKSGYNTLKQAVENLTSITIDRFIGVDFSSLEEIINDLSGVEVTLDDNVYYDAISLEKGRQLLDGVRYVALLCHRSNIAIPSLSNSISKPKALDTLFKSISKNCSTDITAYDFEIYKSGLEQMQKNNNATFNNIDIKTEKVSNRDRLTDNCKDEIVKAFAK